MCCYSNSQKEREESRLKEKTVSIWSFIVNSNHKKFDFVNPFYMSEIDVFFPDTGVENLVLWKGFYFRHTNKVTPPSSMWRRPAQTDRLVLFANRWARRTTGW